MEKPEKIVEIDGELVFIKQHWSDSKFPDAMKQRNKEAKRLRKEGYTVECKKWDFTDLARSCAYTLEAIKPGWEFHSMGGWKRVTA